MSHVAQKPLMSVADYLAGEEYAPMKHEYLAGEVFAMAGASEAHVTITLNVAALLRAHVRGRPCRVYMSDMKLHVAAANSFFYPDVFVTCDPADANERVAKRAPSVIIEVLSKTTEAYDRGIKFAHYRQLASLREYVLIDSRRRAIELYSQQDDGWLLQPLAADAALIIPVLQFSCTADQVYEDVRFDQLESESAGDNTGRWC